MRVVRVMHAMFGKRLRINSCSGRTTKRAHSVRQVRRLAERVTGRVDRLPPAARKVVEVVGDDIGRRLTLRELGKIVNRTPSYLNVMFRRCTGLTIRQYTLFLRMTKAAQEIERGVKIDAVALLVGFRSRKNFYRQFETSFGIKPTALRRPSRARSDS